jgi:hypothetical protein
MKEYLEAVLVFACLIALAVLCRKRLKGNSPPRENHR